MALLRETDRINQARVRLFLDKLKGALWILRDKTIAVLGLSFKPETDDIREAPSIRIIQALLDEGARVRLYDPKAADNMRELFPEDGVRVVYSLSPAEAVEGANAALVCTEWSDFLALDLADVKARMANRILIDGRNLYDPATVRALGFEYFSIGRK
jgi:UDPglucose 6-dehydrogenase